MIIPDEVLDEIKENAELLCACCPLYSDWLADGYYGCEKVSCNEAMEKYLKQRELNK
jgi:hypothetical protein